MAEKRPRRSRALHLPERAADEPTAAPEDDDAPVEVGTDDPPPFTMCPHWMLLSGLSMQARMLWWALAAHVNHKDPEGTPVWPSRKTLADILGLNRPQSVDRYLTELEEAGAIRIELRRVGRMRTIHRYVVRFNRPRRIDAPETVKEFYRRRKVAELGIDNVFPLAET